MHLVTKERRSVDCAELAKIARGMLKAAFPTQKFKVRSQRYAGGSSVDVSWTDGPTEDAVKAVVETLEGREFDGLDDSTHYHDVTLPTGEVVRAYSFVMTARRASAALNARMGVVFERAVGFPIRSFPFAFEADRYEWRLAARLDCLRGVFSVTPHGEPMEFPEGTADPEALAVLRWVLGASEIEDGIRRAQAQVVTS